MNIGDILTRSWQITWKRKALWWAGLINAGLTMIYLPASFLTNPAFSVLWSGNIRDYGDFGPEKIAINLLVTFGFIILMYPVGAFTLAAITVGVLRAERIDNNPAATSWYDQEFTFSTIVRETRPFFWRVLGVFLIYGIVVTAVISVFMSCILGFMLVTMGMGAICVIPFELLIMPLSYLAMAWLEQAILAVIVEGLGVAAAIRRGWEVFRNNFWTMALMVMILYLGVGMIAGFLMLPVMLPFFVAPFSIISTGEIDQTIMRMLWILMFAYMPVVVFIQTIVLIFSQAAWALTFKRLTRKEEPILPVEINV